MQLENSIDFDELDVVALSLFHQWWLENDAANPINGDRFISH